MLYLVYTEDHFYGYKSQGESVLVVDHSLFSLFTQASPTVKLVMLLLMAASVVSWALIFQGRQAFQRALRAHRQFEDHFWSGTDLPRLYQRLNTTPLHQIQGSQPLFLAGFREYLKLKQQAIVDPESVLPSIERAMRVALSKEMDRLEKPLPLLATIGSVSPYVGLFGTVWGIMNALSALGNVQQASLAMVAPGISETLVATALGLFVAIPAVVAYNRYANHLQRLGSQYQAFCDEFMTLLNRQLAAKRSLNTTSASAPAPNARAQAEDDFLDDPLASGV